MFRSKCLQNPYSAMSRRSASVAIAALIGTTAFAAPAAAAEYYEGDNGYDYGYTADYDYTPENGYDAENGNGNGNGDDTDYVGDYYAENGDDEGYVATPVDYSLVDFAANRVLQIAQTADWHGLHIPGDLFEGGVEYRLQARVLDGNTGNNVRFVSQTDANNFAWLGNTAVSATEWRQIDTTFTARSTGLDHVRLVGGAPGTFFADNVVVTNVATGEVIYSNDFNTPEDTSFGGHGGVFKNVVNPLNRVLQISQTADWQGLQIPGSLFVGGGQYRLEARVLDGNTGNNVRFVSQTDANNFTWLGNTAVNTETWANISAEFTARTTGVDHARLVGGAPGTFFVDAVRVTRLADDVVIYANNFLAEGDVSFGGSGGALTNVIDPFIAEIELAAPPAPPEPEEIDEDAFELVHAINFTPEQYDVWGAQFSVSLTHGPSMIDHIFGFEAPNGGADDDAYVARVEHIGPNPAGGDDDHGSHYMAQRNALRLTLPEALQAGVQYMISIWYYIPFDADDAHSREGFGNDRKFSGTTVSYPPGFLINGNAGNNTYTAHSGTWGVGPASMVQGEWANLRGVVQFAESNIETIDIRFHGNSAGRYPDVWYVDAIEIFKNADAELIVPEWDMTLPSLADAFEPWFLAGNIYGGTTSSVMNVSNTREFFAHQFNAITAENQHKPDFIAGPGGRLTRPTADEFNFTNVDPMINWAIANDIAVVGHAFVWHSQTPNWFFGTPQAPLTRAEALDNMEFYIRTLSEHFAANGVLGAFHSWDVANEVIASGGGTWTGSPDGLTGGDWRNQMRTDSGWWRAFSNGYDAEAGEHPSDFVYYSFLFARRYFPYSVLYYNDYNEQVPAKRNAIAQMVEQLNERWFHDFENNPEAVAEGEVYTGRLLVEGLGLQSHHHMPFGGWSTNFAEVRDSLVRFSETARRQGVRLSITELDITAGGFGGNAQSWPVLPEDIAQQQAEVFARVMGYYLEFAQYIERLSIWGLSDRDSWRAQGHPLLFDGDFNAKPAFFAMLEVAENWDAPEVAAPAIHYSLSNAAGVVGDHFMARIVADRGANWAPLTWTVVDGALPTGMNLHLHTGVIEGQAAVAGTYTFTIAATTTHGVDTETFTITITDGAGEGEGEVPGEGQEPGEGETPEVVFGDIDADHNFYTEIQWMAANGISEGWTLEDGTREFRPGVDVTRQQMAAFLFAILAPADFEAPVESPFADVATDNTHFRQIAWMATSGISEGWDMEDGTFEFRPAQPIQRDAISIFLHRAAGLPDLTMATDGFIDMDPAHSFYNAVRWLHEAGIATGTETDYGFEFRPGQALQRQALAAFLHRAVTKGHIG